MSALPFSHEFANNGASWDMRVAGQPSAMTLPAAIDRYLEVALYLLVLTGFGTLASTGGLDVLSLLFVGLALVVRGYLVAVRQPVVLTEKSTNLLTLGYGAFYLADYFTISRAFLRPTVHLVLFLMVLRLFSLRRDRDRYFLAVIAFLMVLSAAVLTVDSMFLVAFAVFMLVAVVAFILMEMRHSSIKATVQPRPSADTQDYRDMAFSLARMTPVLALFILVGATAIFFVLPRISVGYLSAYAPSSEVATGFSDRIELGRIGEIQQSSAVVMHIKVDGDTNGAYNLKWRGISLGVFNGKTWFNDHEQHRVPRLPDGRFDVRPSGPQPKVGTSGSRILHYRVLMEPVGTNVFFLPPISNALRGDYRDVAVDGGGGVFNVDGARQITAYEGWSEIAAPTDAELRAAMGEYPPEILLNYLQLPSVDPRIQRLAEQITASTPHNSYDKAAAIERYLRTKFQYTLELPRAIPHDPLAHFLFERKQGHCEYFASSMAVMLRTLRVPARVVNGFRTTEFNDVTSQYIVRASSAHSWVEVYFPAVGWVSFDPTPASPVDAQTGWGRATLYLDALASFWREWVINYDVGHQYALGHNVQRTGWQFGRWLRTWAHRHYEAWIGSARDARDAMSRSPLGWSVGTGLSVGFLLLAANFRRLQRALSLYRVAAHPANAPVLAATVWYERMVCKLSRRGWTKSPSQTPREFVASVTDVEMRTKVNQFTKHYESARFGGSASDAERLPMLYQEVLSAGKD